MQADYYDHNSADLSSNFYLKAFNGGLAHRKTQAMSVNTQNFGSPRYGLESVRNQGIIPDFKIIFACSEQQLMEFTVVNINTSGKGLRNNRIIEICIVRLNENGIMDKFVSLVNPGRRIPDCVTSMTGIDDNMVLKAPQFEEIAAQIVKITDGAVFVAHNVTFVYSVLRNEFKYLGYDFRRKKLSTEKFAKILMPRKLSYDLKRLCHTLGIPSTEAQRAEGDTDATVILLQRLMSLDSEGMVFDGILNGIRSRSEPIIPREIIGSLPQVTGVYYFKNGQGKIIYVGKAVRIKERVLAHYYNANGKEYELCRQTDSVDFVKTGCELVALLLEAAEIQNHVPDFNKVQKKLRAPYCIVHYINRKGILQFGLNRKTATDLGVITYWRREDAISRLNVICGKYALCPRFTGLQPTKGACSHDGNRECKGMCEERENVSEYNRRAYMAVRELDRNPLDYAIVGKGRKRGEHSFVLVTDGLYRGYGFFYEKESIRTLWDLESYVTRKKNTYHTTRIIASYLNANPEVVKIDFAGPKDGAFDDIDRISAEIHSGG